MILVRMIKSYRCPKGTDTVILYHIIKSSDHNTEQNVFLLVPL